MNIIIPETTVVIQEALSYTGTEVKNAIVTDDLFTYASISFSFGEKQFSGILWDENSSPSYSEIGVWDNDDVIEKILQIIQQ